MFTVSDLSLLQNSGGSELLLAHGLPMSKWSAEAMGVAQFKAKGIGNRALASMAGNSMHAAAVACLFHALIKN